MYPSHTRPNSENSQPSQHYRKTTKNMSSDTTPKESSDHLEQRKTLILLEDAIDALKVHTLDASQLDELNIKRQPMALNRLRH
ncbi:hypothetical protein VN97_g5415 [Penicillium thymicola]|uniref:Uncharacterized protein n=1 Tax=Penicillium thymicola TaxID=293382 RepID=A0AAI9TIS0_PENTH|nr:hypothetical protein VN97_g5415 [Penicillium thymicola]